MKLIAKEKIQPKMYSNISFQNIDFYQTISEKEVFIDQKIALAFYHSFYMYTYYYEVQCAVGLFCIYFFNYISGIFTLSSFMWVVQILIV